MTKEQLQQELRKPYIPEGNHRAWITVLKEILPSAVFFREPVSEAITSEFVPKIERLGEVKVGDEGTEKTIVLLAAETSNIVQLQRNRAALRNIAARIVQPGTIDGALVVFYQPDSHQWRLTFIAKQVRLNQETYKTEREETPTKRYTFLLGGSESCKTAAERLSLLGAKTYPTFKDFYDAFSVEKLNKEFYTKVQIAFDDLVHQRIPTIAVRMEDDEQKQHFAIRLLGRLVFCWFLKRKGIVPDTVLSSAATEKFPNYYKDLLEPLFFDVFNTPKSNRKKTLPDVLQPLPYLNGGLFDDDAVDCHDLQHFHVPDTWFKGFFANTLEMYNFTIDENSADDAEVAIDPEMLGRIFESLLGEINPETQKSARKATGSFYTPREIVNYMVEESLIAYLQSQIPAIKSAVTDETQLGIPGIAPKTIGLRMNFDAGRDARQLESAVIRFVRGEEFHYDLKDIAAELLEALDNLKILDPACGSGAFPMGCLIKLVALKVELKKELGHEDYKDFYHIKLQTLQRSIFGVDIQPMATELSRLRSWLSLMVETDVGVAAIEPLPNLDFKFVCANTLIGIPHEEYPLGNMEQLIAELRRLRGEHFAANAEHKSEIERQFVRVQKEIARYMFDWKASENTSIEAAALAAWQPFDNSRSDWFDPFWMYGNTTGFNIVIGNPPYVRADEPLIGPLRKEIMKSGNYETLWEKWDIYVAFIEKGYKLLAQNGVLSYIIPDAFMASKYAQKPHQYFVNNALVNRVNFLSEIKVFDAAVKNIIIELKKAQNLNHKPLRVKHIEVFEKQIILPSKLQSELLENVFSLQDEKQVVGNIDNTISWENICYVSKGMVLQSDEQNYKGEFTKDDLISEYQDVIHSKPYVEAKWIKRYYIQKVKYLEWQTNRVPSRISRPTFNELYIPEKILLGSMTGGTYDKIGLVCNHSCCVSVLWHDLSKTNNLSINNSIRKDFKVLGDKTILKVFRNTLEMNSKGFRLKYLLAILNSKFGYNFLNSYRRSQMGFYSDDLKQLPIKIIDLSEQYSFEKLVDIIITGKQQGIDTGAAEAEIDARVFMLYGLTEEQLNTVLEGSAAGVVERTRIRNFFQDLQNGTLQ